MKGKEFEPSLDKVTAAEIGKYVRHWLKEYIKNPGCEPKVLEKLRAVFSSDSDYQAQILKVNDFGTVFYSKIGKRRMPILKDFLMKIDPVRYGTVHY